MPCGGPKKSPRTSSILQHIFSPPQPKAHGELIVYQSSRRPSVCPSTLLNINISETSGPIALSFEQDQIGTLVSMATDSSHWVIMWKSCSHSSTFIFDRIFFILADNQGIYYIYYISYEFEFQPDSTKDCGVSCP